VADVIALPTAAADPPPRIRWRGKYPRVVTTLAPWRAKREYESKLQRRAERLALAARDAEEAQIERNNACADWLRDNASEIDFIGLAVRWKDGRIDAMIHEGECDLSDAAHVLERGAELLRRER
jgi:hypothetical protein